MSIPTLTVPAFIGPAGGSGLLSDLESGAGAAGVVAVGAGLVGIGAAAVVIPLLAAPAGGALAVGGVVGGSILATGAFLEALQQLREWGLVNWRPETRVGDRPNGTTLQLGPTDVSTQILATLQNRITERVRCSDGAALSDVIGAANAVNYGTFSCNRILVEVMSPVTRIVCAGGATIPAVQRAQVRAIRANGTTAFQAMVADGGQTVGSNASKTEIRQTNLRFVRSGVEIPWAENIVGTFPDTPGVRPQLFPQTLPDAPTLPAPPLREPIETPVLPPPPDRRPLAPPVVVPRPGQQPARVPVAPGPGGQPVPGGVVRIVPTGGGVFVPPVGPVTTTTAPPVIQTPPQTVIVDGLAIGGPGQAPAPNLMAIAQELGRQEQKLEIVLRRPENGGGGQLAENSLLAILRGLLEQLVDELLNDVPGGLFSLSHACPSSGGAEPPPPVEVPYNGGSNPTQAILAKLDGLAGLIQVHKNMGQPTCKTAVFGQEVTVHFESDA